MATRWRGCEVNCVVYALLGVPHDYSVEEKDASYRVFITILRIIIGL